MSYAIESGIPLPARMRPANNAESRARCALGAVLRELGVGDSVKLDTLEEYNRARGLFVGCKPRRFVCRKIPREGWRVWRVQ